MMLQNCLKRLVAAFVTLALLAMESSSLWGQTTYKARFPQDENSIKRTCTALGLRVDDYLPLDGPVRTQDMMLCSALGPLGLQATDALAAADPAKKDLNLDGALKQLSTDATFRDKVIGGLTMGLMKMIQDGKASPEVVTWATYQVRLSKILSAKGALDEYARWKANPCTYTGEGYQPPPGCGPNLNIGAVFKYVDKAPMDLIGKAGLRASLGHDKAIAAGVATALSGTSAGLFGAVYNINSLVMFFVFEEGVKLSAGVWGGLAGGPAAVLIFAGTLSGIAISEAVEAAMVEPNLKRELGAAITEKINVRNFLADEPGQAMFFASVATAMLNPSWQRSAPRIDGEVSFRNEAGYVSKFTLSYKLIGQEVKSTRNLNLGENESLPIPFGATNIVARGYMIAAGEKLIFEQPIPAVTYTCFKTYNTVFNPSWANAWPLRPERHLKLFHEGGYVARYLIQYNVNNFPEVKFLDGKTAGWTQTFVIPENAKNILVTGWGATGLAWEPWRQTFQQNYPEPPNVCIKTYGTTLDQKFATDCQF